MLPGFAGIAGAGGQKLVSYQSFTVDTTNAATYTFSSVAIGTASPDRVVIVAVASFVDATQSISSATIGGVSESVQVQAINNGVRVGIISAVVPTGTTATIVINMTTSGGLNMGIGVWTATGLPNATALGTNSNTTLAGLAVTSESGGIIVAVTGNVDSRTMTWTNATENYDQSVEAITFTSGASGQTTGTSTTVTATASGATTTGVIAAATF